MGSPSIVFRHSDPFHTGTAAVELDQVGRESHFSLGPKAEIQKKKWSWSTATGHNQSWNVKIERRPINDLLESVQICRPNSKTD